MRNSRSELLRTQTVHSVLGALGATEVHTFGNDSFAGGVFLREDGTVSRVLYWNEQGKRYEYDVRVSVEVSRRELD